MITITQLALRAGVERRWLRRQIEKGNFITHKAKGPGHHGFIYMMEEQDISRAKMRWLRGRRISSMAKGGGARDGITYYHDGSIKKI